MGDFLAGLGDGLLDALLLIGLHPFHLFAHGDNRLGKIGHKKRQIKRQKSKGKWQKAFWPPNLRAQVENAFRPDALLPFAFCHLPFDLPFHTG
jgi:hypothetical protein